jgi:LmbE family N-acetylglucosaminyl deacetylase
VVRDSKTNGAALGDPASPDPTDVTDAWLLRPGGRPLFVFAHQDDETVLAGIIRRIVGADERGAFVWWTNGDGLAPGSDMSIASYARMRMAECSEALYRLGASERRKTDLESSEIENYRRLTHVAQGGTARDRALHYFDDEAARVEQAVRAADPDRVFVLAYQGGHPEHDLVHLMTARAVRRLRRETGRPIPIVQCPAYEYTIACALRFKPWFRGDRRSIELARDEIDHKRDVFSAYPSQSGLFESFERWIRLLGVAGIVGGGRVSVEQYLGREQFGVVEPSFPYTRSTHRFEQLNYMFDDFEGTPIRFDTMVRPVAETLLARNPQ